MIFAIAGTWPRLLSRRRAGEFPLELAQDGSTPLDAAAGVAFTGLALLSGGGR